MKYFIDLFGCMKNQVDAENMMALLNDAGWIGLEEADGADLIIINSCGFIESAKKESINAVLSWRKLFPEKKILLAGCLAQRYAEDLARELPEANAFFGISDLFKIIETASLLVPPASSLKVKNRASNINGRRPLLSPPGSAFVKISEGCDNCCSYCAIPLIRGRLKSRNDRDIVEECKILLDRGIKELCLIGQDTGSYGMDLSRGDCLPGLLEDISLLEGNFRVRLLYIHPDNFPLQILDVMEKDKRILPYFDIPFQHGSEKILGAMNRRGNPESYLDLIKTIRGRFKDAVIRSTFMTGFPGETEEDFEQLLDFQQKANLDWLGCFAYSREDNTPAWNIKGRVSKKLTAERKQIIEEKQIPITEKQMERFIGRTFGVLVEEKFEAPGEDDNVFYLGRLPCQAPEVDGAAVISDWRPAGPGSAELQSLELGVIIPCLVIARAGFDLRVQPVKI